MLRCVERIAQAVAALRAVGVVNRSLHTEILKESLAIHPELCGVWMVWEPNAFDGQDADFADKEGHDHTGRFVPMWCRRGSRLRLQAVQGYEKPGTGDWYWVPKSYGELCEIDTYSCIAFGAISWITSEVAPIMERGRVIGAIGTDREALPPREHRSGGKTLTASPIVRVIEKNPNAQRLSTLTGREREVYYWLCEGKSNEEIGIVLGISAHTVKNHLERIFNKLGVENRISAALVSQSS